MTQASERHEDGPKPCPVHAIAAMDDTRAIGRGAAIPWYIPGEQQRFRDLTMGHAVIMGRRTFATIGKPLAGRELVVLTRGSVPAAPGMVLAHSLPEAMARAAELTGGVICVGGGEQIYRALLPWTDRIYLTQIHATFGGDRHFPAFEGAFALVASERIEGPVPYTYLTYQRRR